MESILVIEDDLNFREVIAELLEDQGYLVHQADSAQQALVIAREQAFHLLLSDVRMAGDLDGIGALEAIKAIRPHVKSIVMTGFSELDVPVRAARLQADDYLLKPFPLAQLLASIRTLLEPAGPFRPGLMARLARFTDEFGKRAFSWALDARWRELKEQRLAALQSFFVLMRSQRLSAEESYSAFSSLEPLEVQFHECKGPQWSRLGQAYRDWQLSLLRCLGQTANDSRSVIEWAHFRQLHHKIVGGEVDLSHFFRSVSLWHFAEERRQSVEAFCLYHWLWSEPQSNHDPFIGLEVAGYRLERRRSAGCSQARLYDAFLSLQQLRGFLVLAISSSDDSLPLVQSELKSGRAALLKESLGHHFLLYANDGLWLSRHQRPEGLVPEQAWQLLRPIFVEVEAHHRDGQCSGGFGLSDIECVPGQLPRLRSFSPGPFHEFAHLYTQGVASEADFTLAPEAFSGQEHPTPASDQAVLGRLLATLIVGDFLASDPAQAQVVHSAGTEKEKLVWPQLSVALGSLALTLRRLCHAQPDQRYPNLRDAIGEIDSLLNPQLLHTPDQGI